MASAAEARILRPIAVAAAVGDARIPFVEGHLKLPNCETPRKCYHVLRGFVVFMPQLACGEPIVKVPAGTMIISGQSLQSLNVSAVRAPATLGRPHSLEQRASLARRELVLA